MYYPEKYFRSLTPGKWHQIKDLPPVIGISGFADALREQILLPDYYITVGKYYATFRIDEVKKVAREDNYDIQQTA